MEIVLIPALQPDEKLLTLLEALQAQKLQAVVIDDGSGDAYDEIFQAAEQYGAVVRRLAHNRGKGGALKYGLQQIMQLFPACSGVITADADGQHRINDIRAVQQELQRGAAFVLTVRNLRGKIPKKSKLGNTLSRYVYTVFTGHYFADNQSGLRGFSAEQFNWLLLVPGEKYDYELNMLCYADKQAVPITTISIEAIYIDGNRSTHFDALRDTFRIYRLLLRSVWASFAGVLLTEVLVFSVFRLAGLSLCAVYRLYGSFAFCFGYHFAQSLCCFPRRSIPRRQTAVCSRLLPRPALHRRMSGSRILFSEYPAVLVFQPFCIAVHSFRIPAASRTAYRAVSRCQ